MRVAKVVFEIEDDGPDRVRITPSVHAGPIHETAHHASWTCEKEDLDTVLRLIEEEMACGPLFGDIEKDVEFVRKDSPFLL